LFFLRGKLLNAKVAKRAKVKKIAILVPLRFHRKHIVTDAEEIAELLEDMHSGDENRLINAAPMLAQFGTAAVSGLVSTLEDSQPLVRDYSAMGLGLIGAAAESAIPSLCRAVHDSNTSVRYAAIVALGRIGKATSDVVESLNAGLSDSEPMNQRGARNALEELNVGE